MSTVAMIRSLYPFASRFFYQLEHVTEIHVKTDIIFKKIK